MTSTDAAQDESLIDWKAVRIDQCRQFDLACCDGSRGEDRRVTDGHPREPPRTAARLALDIEILRELARHNPGQFIILRVKALVGFPVHALRLCAPAVRNAWPPTQSFTYLVGFA